MKKATATLLLILLVVTLSATGLSPCATVIKENAPDGYNVIKNAAKAKWGTDNSMILYEINNQCDSLMNVIEKAIDPEIGNMSIFMQAVIKWSVAGMETYNNKIYKGWLEGADFFTVFIMQCDWSMVEYEYNNQMAAAGAY